MKENMYHTECKISKSIHILPPGEASKGNLMLVCDRKDCIPHSSNCYSLIRSADLQEACLLQFARTG